MNISIRTATLNDINTLRNFSIVAFNHAYAEHNTAADMENYLTTHFSEEITRAELQDASLHFLVAYDNEELVGYAKLNLACEPQTGVKNPVEIARLYTKPEYIGRGIGKMMLRAVEEYALANGHDAIWLSAWQRNFKAINFYQREGFRIHGLTQFQLGDDVQDDFVMLKMVI